MIRAQFISDGLMMEEAELDAEYLIRVKVTQVASKDIVVHSTGVPQPRVLEGVREARLQALTVRRAET